MVYYPLNIQTDQREGYERVQIRFKYLDRL